MATSYSEGRCGRRGVVRFVAVISGLTLLSGCAGYARIRSEPPGAKVFLNDQFVGVTPVEHAVPRSEAQKDYTYRVEKDEYYPASGTLRRERCMTCPFQGFQDFPPVAVELKPATENAKRLQDARDRSRINARELKRWTEENN